MRDFVVEFVQKTGRHTLFESAHKLPYALAGLPVHPHVPYISVKSMKFEVPSVKVASLFEPSGLRLADGALGFPKP